MGPGSEGEEAMKVAGVCGYGLVLLAVLGVPQTARGQQETIAASKRSDLYSVPTQDQDDPRLRRPSEYRVDAFYAFQYFDTDFDPWHFLTAWVERREQTYSLIGRANYAYRFGASAIQFEADAYLLFSRSLYAYLNLGYSPSTGSFPPWRVGGELYGNLPGAWEASGGFRHLVFEDSEVPIVTASVGKYYGNYWTSLRPFVALDEGDTSWSLVLNTRRYFVDADNYVGFLVSYGDAPDERVTEAELDRLSTLIIEIGGKHPISPSASWQWTLGYQNEELTDGRFRNRIGTALAIETRF